MIDGNGNLTLSDHYKHELASFINFLLILCDINIFRTTKYTKADIDFEKEWIHLFGLHSYE